MNDVICLRDFGWEGVTIPINLSDICAHLPKWHQLKSLRSPRLAGSHELYFPHAYFYESDGSVYMPAFEKNELHNDNGGYSQIFKGMRSIYKPIGDKYGEVRLTKTDDFKEICIKEIALHIDPDKERASECIEEINAILYEAYLHALIYKTLERVNLASCVPKLYEVVAVTINDERQEKPTDIESIWMTMEFMEGNTLEKYLKGKLSITDPVRNTAIIKEILLQLANILYILQSKLWFNHRDLKVNNVYVRHHKEAWSRTMDISGLGTFTFTTDVVLLDYGFSCISCGTGPTPRQTLLGAGSYFRPDDECMKGGRDLAQFLYSLHCSYSLMNYVTPAFFDVLHAAVRAERGGRRYDLFMGVDSTGAPLHHHRLPRSIKYNNGIYHFLRDKAVDVPGCEPYRLMQALLSVG